MSAYTPRHCATAPRKPAPRPWYFRLAMRLARRKPAAPALPGAGAATALLADAEPVLRDRWVHDVRAETDARKRARQHADLMHAGYANAVDRLRQEAGLPTVKQMRELRAGSPPWLFPPLEEPLWEEPTPRGPVHDTRMDVAAPHYAPDVVPEWGTAPQLEVAPELARGLVA
jgi:hypothetical protein